MPRSPSSWGEVTGAPKYRWKYYKSVGVRCRKHRDDACDGNARLGCDSCGDGVVELGDYKCKFWARWGVWRGRRARLVLELPKRGSARPFRLSNPWLSPRIIQKPLPSSEHPENPHILVHMLPTRAAEGGQMHFCNSPSFCSQNFNTALTGGYINGLQRRIDHIPAC
jgi:hypothetical protein